MEKTSKELLQLEHKDSSSSFKVLGKVKDFLGLISEANKTLQLNAKDKPEEFDIEVLHGNESEYIEMDLMLGVADLQTPEAMEAAEAAMAGNQPVVDLCTNDSSSESESSSDDEEDDSDEDETLKVGSSKEHSDMLVDGSPRQQSESRTKRKQPKIVVLP